MDQIVLKEHPELRHFLAHVIDAIRANAGGRPLSALEHCASIESLVLWEDDEDEESDLRRRHGLHKEEEEG